VCSGLEFNRVEWVKYGRIEEPSLVYISKLKEIE